MKMKDKLNQIFDLDPEEIEKTNLPVLNPTSEDMKMDDFDLARNTLRDLIVKNQDVLNGLVDLAKDSESARVYEVVGQLVKAQSEVAKDLMGLHKQKKDVDGDAQQKINTQNNIMFAGSTSDLMKMISNERAKIIDSK